MIKNKVIDYIVLITSQVLFSDYNFMNTEWIITLHRFIIKQHKITMNKDIDIEVFYTWRSLPQDCPGKKNNKSIY